MIQGEKVSIKDIAKKVGVSPSLVSFVLNGKQEKYRVNAQVAQKIKEIAQEMDYKPNPIAKSLRKGRSNTIGVILSDISNPSFANIAKEIERTAEKYDYAALFTSSDEDSSRAENLVNNMIYRGVSGIIMVPCEGSEDLVKSIIQNNIPLVLLDRYFPKTATSYVCLDNRKAGADITSYLISKGYKKIGMIAYGQDLQHMKDRISGFLDTMESSGLSHYASVRYVNHKKIGESCAVAVSELLELNVEAMLFATNSIGVNCLGHLLQKGIKIPEEMGVFGFDGGEAFDFFRPELSFLKQPLEEMSEAVTEMIIRYIENGKSTTEQLLFPGKLIIRG